MELMFTKQDAVPLWMVMAALLNLAKSEYILLDVSLKQGVVKY